MLLLEEVFKLSGVPTHTFVRPLEFDKLLVSLRTPGRGLVIEGPSGIGKTTAIVRAIADLNLTPKAIRLTPRKREDREIIQAIPDESNLGLVIIDDFHKLDGPDRQRLADFMKVLADEESASTKLILVGINRAGESLVQMAPDLNTRIDTIRFESNPDEKVEELLSLGEAALNVRLNTKRDIMSAAAGSFFLAQFLAHETCLAVGVTQSRDTLFMTQVSFEAVKIKVMETLDRSFSEATRKFCLGVRERTEGRGPYLAILKWLSESDDWSISLERELTKHPEARSSVGQVVEKGYLAQLFNRHDDLSGLMHYDDRAKRLTVEDPKYIFYLRNTSWNSFARMIGFTNARFDRKYDFALSFAGTDRDVAKAIYEALSDEYGVSVFYDFNEQHRIIGEDVEEYLKPIYKSEATYVICLLGPDYPKRIWTKFESQQFKDRFKDGVVFPIVFESSPLGVFDDLATKGGLPFDRSKDFSPQITHIAKTLYSRWREDRVADVAQGL